MIECAVEVNVYHLPSQLTLLAQIWMLNRMRRGYDFTKSDGNPYSKKPGISLGYGTNDAGSEGGYYS